MKYTKWLDPELKIITKNVPYNKTVIKCANIFLPIALFLTAVPRDITHKSITLRGYQGLKFRTEIFEPSDEKGKLPCLLYVHGGAFSYKASVHHKNLACLYAGKAKCRVFFPDYHLLPKYPYPAAYEDVLTLYKWIAANADKTKIDPEKIGAAGDSAGAALAALITNRCEQERVRPPCLQMLVYPVTDITMRTDSMKKFSDTPLWNAKNNRQMWSYYCGNLKTEDQFALSPLHNNLPQIIPDTYLETAEFDCLHDEGLLYGRKLQQAGAKVEINETKGTIHGYDSAIHTEIARRNIEKRIAFLRTGFDAEHR